jgi:hypothetical protein
MSIWTKNIRERETCPWQLRWVFTWFVDEFLEFAACGVVVEELRGIDGVLAQRLSLYTHETCLLVAFADVFVDDGEVGTHLSDGFGDCRPEWNVLHE